MSAYTTSSSTYSGESYTVYSFLSGTDVMQFDRNVDAYVLLIGGGGGGGCGATEGEGEGGAGGGAGAMVTFSYTFLANTKYYIVVGKGGQGGAYRDYEVTYSRLYHRPMEKGYNGENSKIYSSGLNVIAYGGGGGGGCSIGDWSSPTYDARKGSSGGSGGGSVAFFVSSLTGGAVGTTTSVGVTSNVYQNTGGTASRGHKGSGGGGAGSAGVDTDSGANGGSGRQWEIDSVFYAGGGGGGYDGSSYGSGGSGGGGRGGNAHSESGVDASLNTGSGGGGAARRTTGSYCRGGCGGSGVVKIAFKTNTNAVLTCTGTGPGRTNIIRADHIAYYYPLSTNIYDYATGTAIDNASMYNFTLTNNNIVSSNRLGQMFKLPRININGNGFTVSFWFRIDSGYTNYARIFEFGRSSPDRDVVLYIASDTLKLAVARDTSIYLDVTMMSITTGTYYFFSVVFDPANPYTIKCQLNGTKYTYTDQSYYYPSTLEFPDCYFGKGRTETATSKLYLKQIVIFYRALHDTEINTLYDNSGTTFQIAYNTMPANTININNNRLAYYYSFNNNYSCDIPALGIKDVMAYNTSLITNDNVAGSQSVTMTTDIESYCEIDNFAPGKYGYTISFWAKTSQSTLKKDTAHLFAFVPNATFPSLGTSMFNRINQSGYVDGLVVYASNGTKEGTANYYSDLNTGYIQDGKWHHYCITQKQFTGKFPDEQVGDISLYIDGVLYKTVVAYYPYTYLNPAYQSIGTGGYRIGTHQDSIAAKKFELNMNNFIVFYRVLTNEEIRYLYSVPQQTSITFTANPTTPVLASVSSYQVNSRGMIYPVGSVLAYMGSTDPDGWVICDGLPRYVFDSRYRNLLQIGIGTGTPNQYTPPNYRASVLRGTGSKIAYNTSSSNNAATFTGPPIGQAQEVKSVSGSKKLCCVGVNWIIKL